MGTNILASEKNQDLIKSDNYVFDIERFPDLKFKCTSVNLPGISLGFMPFEHPIEVIKLPGTSLIYEDLILTFLIDDNLTNYKTIYNWMHVLKTLHNQEESSFNDLENQIQGIREGYFSDCILMILSNKNNIIQKVKFTDCFPYNLGDLDFRVGETTEIIMNVTFAYTRFEFI